MNEKSGIKVLLPVIALFLCGIVVLAERWGIAGETQQTANVLDRTSVSEAVMSQTTCLILTDGLTDAGETSAIYTDMSETVLSGMKLGYDIRQVDRSFDAEILQDYETVIITFPEWSNFGDQLLNLMDWVKNGGKLLVAVTPSMDVSLEVISAKLGIVNVGAEYPPVYGIRLKNDCMIGAAEEDVFWYDKEEGMVSSLQVELDEKSTVWMESEDGEVPLIWTRDYGEGRIAVINEVISGKYQRGFLCMTYTLLQDAILYPVINASAFYLDDFPSPVPAGDGTYIKRDYGVDIETFYSSIWWPEILEWEEKYGIRHTGVIIEDYSDTVKAPFERNESVDRFLIFGNMLLSHGGELGFHGYNHMPLCLEGVDEDRQYGDYKLWNSGEDVAAAIKELRSFSEGLFPGNTLQVYVPPSNILSEAGRQALLEADPGIRVIASTYPADAEAFAYEQEFRVEEDGVISTPRITSGCVLDDYQKLLAMAELNFHYVQSHFMHPDDTLDEDRGAALGWEYMSSQFEEYLDWIADSAAGIRNVTGSEMGKAVQDYDGLSVYRERTKEGLHVLLGGFSGQASFLLRVNEGQVTGTEGCTCEAIKGGLYLVQASEAEINIFLGE